MNYTPLSAFEQVALQKENERLKLIVWIVLVCAFTIGCLLGTLSNFVKATMPNYDQKHVLVYDFLAANPNVREEFCRKRPRPDLTPMDGKLPTSPTPMGGYISRKIELKEHCAYFARRP